MRNLIKLFGLVVLLVVATTTYAEMDQSFDAALLENAIKGPTGILARSTEVGIWNSELTATQRKIIFNYAIPKQPHAERSMK